MNAPLVKLGDVCEVVRGITYTKSDEVDVGGLAVLRSTNINLERNTVDLSDLVRIRSEVVCDEQKIVHRNTILICLANGSKKHLGKVALITEELGCAFGGFMGLLIPKTATISMPYLFHFLISPSAHKRLVESVEGTNINNLRVETVRNLMLPLPPLAEQERIVAHLERTLGAIDAMEAKFREMAETAERHFRATLDESFAALSSAPAATLGEVCEVVNGYTPKADTLRTYAQVGYVPYYRVAAMNEARGGRWMEHPSAYCPATRRIFPKNAIIFPKNGGAVYTGKVRVLTEASVVDLNTAVLIPQEQLFAPYLYYFIRSLRMEDVIVPGTVPFVDFNLLRACSLPLPSLAEQERVVARLERAEGVSRRVVALAQEGVAQCGVYRRAVLSEAFGGGEGGGDE